MFRRDGGQGKVWVAQHDLNGLADAVKMGGPGAGGPTAKAWNVFRGQAGDQEFGQCQFDGAKLHAAQTLQHVGGSAQ